MLNVAGFTPIKFVEEGQQVWAELGPDLVRCTVQTAMGTTARIVNERRGIDTWARLDQLYSRD